MRSRGSGGSGSASAIYATTPQVAALAAASNVINDSGNFGIFTQDNRVRGGGYLTQFVPTVNDFVTFQFTLGPQGSLWALRFAFAQAPDAGQFGWYLASVAEPDPNRGGVDDAGTLLRSDDVTYVSFGGPADGYAAAFGDFFFNGQVVLRLTGDDHTPMTQIGATTDPWTGYRETDGGSGVYRAKLAVTGKNAASTGYKVYLTALAMLRLDDNGFP